MNAAEVLAGAGMGSVLSGQPLPLRPAGSVEIGPAACLVEDDEGGMTFIWGMASSYWKTGDVVGQQLLAAVALVATKAARHGEVAKAFGVDYDTLRIWRRAWEADGVEALRPDKRGPKKPSKLTDELAERIRAARAEGKTLAQIAFPKCVTGRRWISTRPWYPSFSSAPWRHSSSP